MKVNNVVDAGFVFVYTDDYKIYKRYSETKWYTNLGIFVEDDNFKKELEELYQLYLNKK